MNPSDVDKILNCYSEPSEISNEFRGRVLTSSTLALSNNCRLHVYTKAAAMIASVMIIIAVSFCIGLYFASNQILKGSLAKIRPDIAVSTGGITIAPEHQSFWRTKVLATSELHERQGCRPALNIQAYDIFRKTLNHKYSN